MHVRGKKKKIDLRLEAHFVSLNVFKSKMEVGNK